ncbi:MAG: hypothetical protein J6Z11_12440 [Candidatus Riflebacteria bacterium]|nr:hypothetical protein [Candidatus Riflebacteria bacterium]
MTLERFYELTNSTIPSKVHVNEQTILIARHYLLTAPIAEEDVAKTAYYNAFLYANFGIIVDKPKLLSDIAVKEISDLFKLDVPASFYKNPQDTKYYTRGELFVNQVLSYFLAYGEANSTVDIFGAEKDLPSYPVGDEIKIREFKILTVEEADEVLADIAKAYADYKRPWSLDEENEFVFLYEHGYYKNFDILCGDNAITMLKKDANFARFLYKKDLVKLSVSRCGEKSKLVLDAETADLIRKAIPLVKNCPMTKKQAKYFNTLINKVGAQGKVKLATNDQSPYAKAQALLNQGDVLGAAKVYAANGSLFERNIKTLISRADPATALEIIKMIPAKNPIALYQFVTNLMEDNGGNRTFTFTKNRLVKKHKETDYEAKWRKSRLNEATRKLVKDATFTQIEAGYRAQPSLGKVYVSPDFFKVSVPVNTSASGKGIDVLPAGSRIPVRGNKIRTFVHWEHAFDIDSSLIIVNSDDTMDRMYFGNYYGKAYGSNILFSGDVTSSTGTEYYDIDLDGLREHGVKYIIQTFHGFCSNLNSGEIYCGYQDKKNLNTKAWDPKNIELKIHVKGDTRAFMSFGIDLATNEVVIFNMLLDEDSRVVNTALTETVRKYLSANCLDLNMGLVAQYRASEVVTDPTEADVVFDANFKPEIITETGKPAQKVIRPYDVEKLVQLANGAELA